MKLDNSFLINPLNMMNGHLKLLRVMLYPQPTYGLLTLHPLLQSLRDRQLCCANNLLWFKWEHQLNHQCHLNVPSTPILLGQAVATGAMKKDIGP